MTARLITTVAMLLLLVGCSAGPPPMAAVHPTWTGCPTSTVLRDTTTPPTQRASVPADFVPVSGLVCQVKDVRTRRVLEERPLSEVAALTAALRRPSEETSGNRACPAVLIVTPWLVLIDADGRWVQPSFPLDVCEQPLQAAMDAFSAAQH